MKDMTIIVNTAAIYLLVLFLAITHSTLANLIDISIEKRPETIKVLRSLFDNQKDRTKILTPEKTISQFKWVKILMPEFKTYHAVNDLLNLCQPSAARCSDFKEMLTYHFLLKKDLRPTPDESAKNPHKHMLTSSAYHCMLFCQDQQFRMCADRLEADVSRYLKGLSKLDATRLKEIHRHFSTNRSENMAKMIRLASFDALGAKVCRPTNPNCKLVRSAGQRIVFNEAFEKYIAEPCKILDDNLDTSIKEYLDGGQSQINPQIKDETRAWLELKRACSRILLDVEGTEQLVYDKAVEISRRSFPRRILSSIIR